MFTHGCAEQEYLTSRNVLLSTVYRLLTTDYLFTLLPLRVHFHDFLGGVVAGCNALIGDHFAVFEADDALGVFGDVLLVGDDDDGFTFAHAAR